jgi:hypothetical protein
MFPVLTHVKRAAGCISLFDTANIPREAVLEFSEPLLRSLQQLMVAQAQQCAWRKAVMSMTSFPLFSFVSPGSL